MPKPKPSVKHKPGRITIPGDLWRDVKIAAAEEGSPVSRFIGGILTRHMAEIRRRESIAQVATRPSRSAA